MERARGATNDMRSSLRLLGALAALGLLVPRAGAAEDTNRNGLEDGAEEALLARFAPVVILAPGERALPANVDWYLSRARLDPEPTPAPRVTQASLLADLETALRAVGRRVARLRPNRAARPGSPDPRDWVVYGHVYPAARGGVLVQYWFFYPFNDFHVLFDHDGDWEHVTVRLDSRGRPLGAWYARHAWSAPGRWFEWRRLEREGDHPVVLSARGSHASYAEPDDVLFWDDACGSRVPADAERLGCRVWRTWASGTGGIVNTGPRDRPRARATFVSWPGQWGTLGWLRRETGGPPGPAYQAGWCSEGAVGCR
jgi:Vacuolar protein sorting-associated protein 62